MATDRHPMLGSVPGRSAAAAKTTTTKTSSAPKGSHAFNVAFRAARKAGKAEFSFGGKRFNTKLAPTTTKTVTTKAVAAKPASQVSLNRQGRLETAMGTNSKGQRVPATGDVAGREKARHFFDRAPATEAAKERARKALDRGGDFKARSEATFKRSLADGVLMAAGGPMLRGAGAVASKIPGVARAAAAADAAVGGVAARGVNSAKAGLSKLFGAGLRKPTTAAATKTVAETVATKAAPAATKTVAKTVATKAAAKPAATLAEKRATIAASDKAASSTTKPLSARARLNSSTASPRPANTTPNIRNPPARTPEITKTTRLEGTKVVSRGGERAVPKAEMRAALKVEKVADKAALAGAAKSPAEVVAAARARGMMPSRSVATANIANKMATPLSTRATLNVGTATRGLPPGSAASAVRSGERAAKVADDAMTARTNAEATRRAGVQNTWTRRQAERSRAEVDNFKGADAKPSAPTRRTRAPNKPKTSAQGALQL